MVFEPNDGPLSFRLSSRIQQNFGRLSFKYPQKSTRQRLIPVFVLKLIYWVFPVLKMQDYNWSDSLKSHLNTVLSVSRWAEVWLRWLMQDGLWKASTALRRLQWYGFVQFFYRFKVKARGYWVSGSPIASECVISLNFAQMSALTQW